MCTRHNQRHKAVAHLLAGRKEQASIKHSDRFFKVDRFMLTYEEAYREYFGTLCSPLTYAHGWYYVHGGKVRHNTLERMTEVLLARLQERNYPDPSDYADNLEEEEP